MSRNSKLTLVSMFFVICSSSLSSASLVASVLVCFSIVLDVFPVIGWYFLIPVSMIICPGCLFLLSCHGVSMFVGFLYCFSANLSAGYRVV